MEIEDCYFAGAPVEWLSIGSISGGPGRRLQLFWGENTVHWQVRERVEFKGAEPVLAVAGKRMHEAGYELEWPGLNGRKL